MGTEVGGWQAGRWNTVQHYILLTTSLYMKTRRWKSLKQFHNKINYISEDTIPYEWQWINNPHLLIKWKLICGLVSFWNGISWIRSICNVPAIISQYGDNTQGSYWHISLASLSLAVIEYMCGCLCKKCGERDTKVEAKTIYFNNKMKIQLRHLLSQKCLSKLPQINN